MMFKINKKIQFLLFVVCLFFIGLGISDILTEGLKTGVELFKQISPLVPFVIFGGLFYRNIYMKKSDN